METYNATIERKENSAVLKLTLGSSILDILLTDDKPAEVKGVFNTVLATLKEKEFMFELKDEKEDLYFHICNAYITQLNAEMVSIRKELEDLELATTD